MERKTVWNSYTPEDQQQLQQVSDGYRDFLDRGKTERECVSQIIAMAEAAGYQDLEQLVKSGKQLQPGAKVYAVCMKKAIALFHLGTAPLEQGMAILGAHIDSPRLDIKQNPLYEDTELVYLDTHYYGGVKKYQWVTIPLAIHGVVAKKDGSVVEINIGDHDDDPIFCITDLLIHLAAEQQEKKGSKLIAGEDLDLLIGSMPLADTEKDAVKANILQILADQYGIDEEDFLSAELEIVPAGHARECGIDRSMIMAYGHDDRVCAYASLLAMLESETRDKTICCLLMDKEEIGSVGATGTQSRFFENAVAELMNAAGTEHLGRTNTASWHCVVALVLPRCSVLMSALVMTPSMLASMRKRMPPIWVKVLFSINTLALGVKAVLMMPMLNTSPISAASWITIISGSKQQSWVKLILVAAVLSPISWRSMAWM